MEAENTIIEKVNKIEDKRTRLSFALLFIKEIGGNLTHLHNVGMPWGAGGEETRVGKQIIKYEKIVKELEDIIYDLFEGKL